MHDMPHHGERMAGDCDVSVVISTYNRAEVLPYALESLLQQEPPQPHYEIVVVDNNSTDSTRAVEAEARMSGSKGIARAEGAVFEEE
jgi:glycosyltransferase involved in cell wall biosynthesis